MTPAWDKGLATPEPVEQVEEFDPQNPGGSKVGNSADGAELLRCCLARTLMSYAGAPTGQGGAELKPDLASEMPSISADGLTWTFRLRTGLHYAPPLEHQEIVAQDVIRGIERSARLNDGGYGFLDLIRGFSDYAQRKVSTISGLESPDPHTLVVHLLRPHGALSNVLTMSYTAPLPSSPRDPADPLGVAAGHDTDYARFLVSAGPYMIEGSEHLDFTVPTAQQNPVSGFVPGRSLVLVRNPSWAAPGDGFRKAYVDRMEFHLGGTVEDAAAGVDAGAYDLAFGTRPPVQAPLSQIQAYRANPRLGSVHVDSRDGFRLLTLNLAVPPLDDVHVRRAIAWVLDRQHLIDLYGGALNGQVTGHLAWDSVEDGQLAAYSPFPSPGNHGDLARAQAEMRLSRYDSQRTGRCDASACQHLLALNAVNGPPSWQATADSIAHDLAKVGIVLDVRTPATPDEFYAATLNPKQRTPIAINGGYAKDYLNGEDFFTLFSGANAGSYSWYNNFLGATPDQLAKWGYSVTDVPSVDGRIAECSAEVGDVQTRCWSSLDVYLSENIVPMINLDQEHMVVVVPARVVRYSFDQFANMPALDQIAIRR